MSEETAKRYRHWCGQCVDFHAHFLHPEVLAQGMPHSVFTCFGKEPKPLDSDKIKKMLSPELQIEDMQARGIDKCVISSCDVMQGRSWAEPEHELHLTRLVNDQAAEWVDRYPERFIGSFSVPLGATGLALRELDRAFAMGLRVINLPAQYRGDYLGHARFDELWGAVHEKGIVAFVHPDGVPDLWYQDFSMWNSIGQSIEEVRCMSSMIYEGVLDRHRGVKIVMAHGGGYMPHYMGRLDRNAAEKPFTTRNLSKKPSDYLLDFYYDSCVYDPRTLERLVQIVGVDRVILGGDYPLTALDPIDFLDTATGLAEPERAAIAGGNVAAILVSARETSGRPLRS